MRMNITYNDEIKKLPIDQLSKLFVSVGWSPDGPLPDELKAGFMKAWIHSTLVVSAWDGERLVGAVRVLSDTIFRSIIYDLLVSPAYQGKSIGRNSIIGAGAVIVSDIPDNCTAVGVPAKPIKYYSEE